ncbi:transcription elongation factor spt5 [Stygiomarasmius scandens]|uniref:Chromatin elongation factor SPT5 n=1 Tax=Marasmiellus scandens TaxID=2682957 RepID=A0ABR1IYH0_9AGAR
MLNYLDIEAGVEDDSSLSSEDEEDLRGFIDDGDNNEPVSMSSRAITHIDDNATGASSSRVRWSETIERIYENARPPSSQQTPDNLEPSCRMLNDERGGTNTQLLVPGREDDWQLWAVRCKKGMEFNVVHEICLRLQNDEELGRQLPLVLRSAFAPSSDTGFVYFEARSLGPQTLASRFIKSLPGIKRRKRTIIDNITIDAIKDSQTISHVEEFQSVNLVPWTQCTTLLKLPPVQHDQYVAGDWVRIKHGRYSGDLGMVVENNGECLRRDGVFMRRGVKVLLLPCLKDGAIPGSTTPDKECPDHGKKRRFKDSEKPDQRLFMPDLVSRMRGSSVKLLSANAYQFRGDIYESQLLVQQYDYMSVSPASISELSVEQYELFRKSEHPDFKVYRSYQVDRAWKLETGDKVYTDEAGCQREGVLEAVFSTYCEVQFNIGDGVELRRISLLSIWKTIHVGDFVEVIAGVDEGKSGFVVQSGRQCVVFSRFTDKLDLGASMGPQLAEVDDNLYLNKQIEMIKVHPNSLKVSDPAFTPSPPSAPRSIDGIVVPWIGEQVTSIKGPMFELAEVKDVKRNPKAPDTDSGLMLLVDFSLYSHRGGDMRHLFWVDYDWVITKDEALPLVIAKPLGPLQQVYSPNGAYLALRMKTEPAPWRHWRVQVVQGKNKALGTIQDVRRDPNPRPQGSGLLLYVLIDTISAYTPNMKVWEDYDHVRTENTLELLPAPGVHSYYRLLPDYQPSLHIQPIQPRPGHPIRRERTPERPKTPDWNQEDLRRLRPDHWILNPALANHEIEVRITNGPYKADSTFIRLQMSSFDDIAPVIMPKERSKSKKIWEAVPVELIQPSASLPKYKTERNLMIVVRGEHVGKLVRRVRHFFMDKYKTDESARMELAVVTRSGTSEILTDERVELSVHDLARRKESESERKTGTNLMEPLRKEALRRWPAGAPEIRSIVT